MDEAVQALLAAKTIAVVGLDAREYRTAHRIANYLQRAGYRIIPVPLQEPASEVLGERAYASLRDIPEHIDLVDVFVRSEQTGPVIDDAIAAGVGAIWLQQGIRNDEGLARARAAGITATQDRCTMVEHRRHLRD
ncbi:MAG: CoA-binding protein [Tepidiformaceae bacterium]